MKIQDNILVCEFSQFNVKSIEKWLQFICDTFGIKRWKNDDLFLSVRDIYTSVLGRKEEGWKNWAIINIIGQLDLYVNDKDYQRSMLNGNRLIDVKITAYAFVKLLYNLPKNTKNRRMLIEKLIEFESEIIAEQDEKVFTDIEVAKAKSKKKDKVQIAIDALGKIDARSAYHIYNLQCSREFLADRERQHKFMFGGEDAKFQLYRFLQLKRLMIMNVAIPEDELERMQMEIFQGHPNFCNALIECEYSEKE